jgi:hypothetical protein
MSDPDIPDKFKEKFPARRRTRDLQKDLSLGISREFLRDWHKSSSSGSTDELFRAADECGALRYMLPYDCEDHAVVWTFSLVRRKHQVLSYRIGRYRDDRDTFANKCSIGFPGVMTADNRSLFSQGDYGAADNALSVLLLDLDLSLQSFPNGKASKPKPILTFEAEGDDSVTVLLIVLEWSCPNWFEPTTRRLSLNDPHWLNLTVPPNNLDDFEPWSKTLIYQLVEHGLRLE